MIKRRLGGGAGKLLSIKVLLGQGISRFSFHFPPAAEGVGISRDTGSSMRKIPLAEADEPARREAAAGITCCAACVSASHKALARGPGWN